MNKKKIIEIIKFNIEKNIQNKAFIIFNIIIALLVIISINLGNIEKILKANNIDFFDKSFNLKIVDETGLAKGKFEEIYKQNDNISIDYITQNDYKNDDIPDDVVVIEYRIDKSDELKITTTSKESINSNLYDNIISVSKEIRSELFARTYGINVNELKTLNEDIEIEEVMLGIDAENSEAKQIIKTISVFIVYFVLIFVLARIANEIVTEKVSKSIEYVLTSVTAKEYLLAKVLGITLTIIIQVAYGFIYFLIGNSINILINSSELSSTGYTGLLHNFDFSILSYVLVMAVYLIFTVFFLSLIQAVLSSKATSVAEAGNTTTLLITLIIVLYMISLSCIDPFIKVTPFMYIISCIPIVSTFFVPAMMIIGQATTIQIVISFIVLFISAPVLFHFCAKIFKNGILDYSVKNKKKEKRKIERTIEEEQEYLMNSYKIKKFAFVIGLALIIWILIQAICSIFISEFVKNLLSNILSEKCVIWINMIISSVLSIIIPVKFIELYSGKEEKTIKKKLDVKIITRGFSIVFLINIISSVLLRLLGFDYQVIDDEMLVTYSDGLLDKILFIIGLSIIPGIFEELFMRKAVLKYGKQFGEYFAVFVSAFLFGLIHLNILQGVFAFLIGIVLGKIMVKTNDIRYTMIIHMLNNLIFGLTSIFFENTNVLVMIFVLYFLVFIYGIVSTINYLIKNKGIKLDKEKLKIDYKMIFKNYTFDLAIILFIILTILTENVLRSV